MSRTSCAVDDGGKSLRCVTVLCAGYGTMGMPFEKAMTSAYLIADLPAVNYIEIIPSSFPVSAGIGRRLIVTSRGEIAFAKIDQVKAGTTFC